MNGLARIESKGTGSICVWIGPHLITSFPANERVYVEGLVTRINDYVRRSDLPLTIRRRASHVETEILALSDQSTEIVSRLRYLMKMLDETPPHEQDALFDELNLLHTELREHCAEIVNLSLERETIQFCAYAYGGGDQDTINDFDKRHE